MSNGDDNDSDNDVDEKKDDDNVDVADVVINIVMKLGMMTMRMMMMMTLVIATGDNGKHWCFPLTTTASTAIFCMLQKRRHQHQKQQHLRSVQEIPEICLNGRCG